MPEGLLAQKYTLADNFFHAAFGGSFLNHQFLISGCEFKNTNREKSDYQSVARDVGAKFF